MPRKISGFDEPEIFDLTNRPGVAVEFHPHRNKESSLRARLSEKAKRWQPRQRRDGYRERGVTQWQLGGRKYLIDYSVLSG
jgi:hypothetical protein